MLLWYNNARTIFVVGRGKYQVQAAKSSSSKYNQDHRSNSTTNGRFYCTGRFYCIGSRQHADSHSLGREQEKDCGSILSFEDNIVKVERRVTGREVKCSQSEGRTTTFYYPTRLVVTGREVKPSESEDQQRFITRRGLSFEDDICYQTRSETFGK